ncbi:gluconate 2-dehydrogenase subunit 3 family protein [Brevibacillus dissolubilis]|uniref:gluconate 2-dehydrogenase subunit 3 family protein n=1 Tax=Brevibacillus dissolubilis TaxID=1844116 RepID=UPI001116372B|nr:gluconate 2-dehydrogenase subunit 3 family protein [Brevibacillus dissolubilis]
MYKSSHYPAYDVWEQHQEWDEHTRKIVGKRRMAQVEHRFFQQEEARLLYTLAGVLTNEIGDHVLTYITQHIDNSTDSPIGESQRKVGVPEKKTLYRMGLQGLDELAQQKHQQRFVEIKRPQQEDLLRLVEQGQAPMTPAWQQVPQKDFFKKLLHDVVAAYYSHPAVWSEIGYGGPAYPRGYVRVEKGLVDPWEAKRDGTS